MDNSENRLKASVVMATYNGEKYIGEQLKSIVDQSRPVDEIIICDDGSTDKTVDIATAILTESGIEHKIIVNRPNLGVTKNFEKAISLATGDVVFFSDQDDVWLKDKVRNHLKAYENESVKLVFSDAILFNENGDEKETAFERFGLKKRLKLFKKNQLHCIMKGWCVTGATMSARRSFAIGCMPFSEIMLHDQWLSAAAASVNGICVLTEPQIRYRQHDGQVAGAAKIGAISAYKNTADIKRELEIYYALADGIPTCREEALGRVNWIIERDKICSKNVAARFFTWLKFYITGGYGKYSCKPFCSYMKDVVRASYKIEK